MRLINGNVPGNWYFDPHTTHYLHGWGLPEQRLKRILKNIIKTYGVESLQLSDKKELEKEILEFINTDEVLC
jgi:hypothetical protein